jgi:two-component system KDP operon response regulator KdpE
VTGARVLVVDDEPSLLRVVRASLTRHGYQVDIAASGEEAKGAFRGRRPDVILLDLGLPDCDGVSIIEEVRAQASTPIIVLSARANERDKVAALDNGADDYLCKPFGVEELLARIRVALRHAAGPAAGTGAVYRSGALEVDLDRRRVTITGKEVRLTPTEYDLLKAFVRAPGRVLTDRMLLNEVWGPGYGADPHFLHVYVARLRKKLETDPGVPRLIVNAPGVGYRFADVD